MGWARTAYGDVYVVSDGMGGYRGGALAAELTVHSLRNRLAALSVVDAAFPDQVRQAFQAANQSVYERRRADEPETQEMGATAVALITSGSRILVGHVGDSRAYWWRRRGGLQQLTRDHTRVQRMVDAGLVTPTQAVVHPDASVLDRAMGHHPTVEVEIGSWTQLNPGDMVLLCSDGLSGYVDDAEISGVLRSTDDPQILADRLVDCALMKGGEDNVTVQLVRFGGDSMKSSPDLLRWPATLLPIAVLVSAAVAWVVVTETFPATQDRMRSLESKIESTNEALTALSARLDKLAAGSSKAEEVEQIPPPIQLPPTGPEAGATVGKADKNEGRRPSAAPPRADSERDRTTGSVPSATDRSARNAARKISTSGALTDPPTAPAAPTSQWEGP